MADIVNFYEELGLGRDDAVDQIQEDLKRLKLELSNKVTRPSTQQEHWMRQLELLDQAAQAFADEDSRERYDVELGRAKTSDAPIDWTTRAWNYYFVGDNGAALIASRKAKEQAPGEAMPFVISAWVQLKEGEDRQARQDADEAFVLDELTTDSVDVQEVRGSVYLVLGQYDRALICFDRALTKATDGEKPELYFRRALTFQGMDRPAQAYESGCIGLSQDVVISDYVRSQLEVVTSNAIHAMVNLRDEPAEIIKSYKHHSGRVSSTQMHGDSKRIIVDNIDWNIRHWEKIRTLKVQCERDAAVRQPDPAGGVPATGIGCGAIILLAISGLVSFASPAVGVIMLLVVAGMVLAYIVSRINRRTAFAQASEEYSAAQRRLTANEQELTRIYRLDPIALEPMLAG